MAEIPTPDFAVPYLNAGRSAMCPSDTSDRRDGARPFSPPLRAHDIGIATHAAPIQVKMMALAQPIAPKKGA